VENQCQNCGASAPGKFCPECGQRARVQLPTLPELIHEGLGAVFAYDGKLWRTLRILLTRPGQLTLEYVQGKRAPYLTPLQLFVWLQALTWVVHRLWFDPKTTDHRSQSILLIGAVFWITACIVYAPKRIPVVQNLIATAHIWSYMMVVLLLEYGLTPVVANGLIRAGLLHGEVPIGMFVSYSVVVLMFVYTVLALKRIYQECWWNTLARSAVITVASLAVDMVFIR